MIKIIVFALWLSIVLLTSCNEYFSPVPAGSVKNSKIQTECLGLWEFIGQSNDSGYPIQNKAPHYMRIYKFNKHEYVVQIIPHDSILKLGDFQILHRAFTTMIGKHKIVNLVDLNLAKPSGYYIYTYGFNQDTLWIHGFNRYKLDKTFNSSCKLRNYLKKYLSDTTQFTWTQYYVRAEETDSIDFNL